MTSKRSPKKQPPPKRIEKKKGTNAQRLKALALLSHWAKNGTPIELVAGSSGLKIMGHLVRFELGTETGEEHGDFIFKTPFGVAALVFTLIYDEIKVEELIPSAPVVFMSMSKFPDAKFRLTAHEGYRPTAEMLQAAREQFDSWVRDEIQLIVTIGDNMRVSASVCDVIAAGENAYMIRDSHSKTIHVVFLDESDAIEIDRRENGVEVTLRNRRTNSEIAVRSGSETPEQMLMRYPLRTRSVH